MYGGGERLYRILVGKPEGKRPLGRPRQRWEENIKMDLQEVGCGGMDWIELAQDRDRWGALVNVVMKLQVPQYAGNFLTSFKPVSFSRSSILKLQTVLRLTYHVLLVRGYMFQSLVTIIRPFF